MELRTQRLRLIALTADQLRNCADSPAAVDAELGVSLSRAVITVRVRRAIARKLAKMSAADPASHAWYTYWLAVVGDTGFGAGLIGFKGVPDSQGWVEIGYGIDPAGQGRGYATEACRALIDWAFTHPECVSIGAPGVRADNPASCRVLQKLGFRVIRRTAAEVDWILERSATSAA